MRFKLEFIGFMMGVIFLCEQVAKPLSILGFKISEPRKTSQFLKVFGLTSSGWGMFSHGLGYALETRVIHYKKSGPKKIQYIKSVQDSFWRRSFNREDLESLALSKPHVKSNIEFCAGKTNWCETGDDHLEFEFRKIQIKNFLLRDNLDSTQGFEVSRICTCKF